MTKDWIIHGKVFQIHNVSQLRMTNTVLHEYLYTYMLTEIKKHLFLEKFKRNVDVIRIMNTHETGKSEYLHVCAMTH